MSEPETETTEAFAKVGEDTLKTVYKNMEIVCALYWEMGIGISNPIFCEKTYL